MDDCPQTNPIPSEHSQYGNINCAYQYIAFSRNIFIWLCMTLLLYCQVASDTLVSDI